jgi:hypothetical protein
MLDKGLRPFERLLMTRLLSGTTLLCGFSVPVLVELTFAGFAFRCLTVSAAALLGLTTPMLVSTAKGTPQILTLAVAWTREEGDMALDTTGDRHLSFAKQAKRFFKSLSVIRNEMLILGF